MSTGSVGKSWIRLDSGVAIRIIDNKNAYHEDISHFCPSGFLWRFPTPMPSSDADLGVIWWRVAGERSMVYNTVFVDYQEQMI